MRRRIEILFAAALVVTFAWAAWEARVWADNVRTFPLAVALPGLVLAVVQVVASARGSAPAAPADDELRDEERMPRMAVTIAWILAMFAVVWLLGFLVGVPLVALAYLRRAGERWLPSLVVTALCWIFIQGIFDRLLHVPLPPGELLRLFGVS